MRPITKRIYKYILNKAVPYEQVLLKRSEIAQACGCCIRKVSYAVAYLRMVKPWLKIEPRGPRGLGVFYTPSLHNRKVRAHTDVDFTSTLTISTSDTEKNSPCHTVTTKNELQEGEICPECGCEKVHAPGCSRKTQQASQLFNLCHTTVYTVEEDTHSRRRIMRKWRNILYRDISAKWALRKGVHIIKIIGKIVWRFGLTPRQAQNVCITFWRTFTSGSIPLPPNRRALYNALFALAHRLTPKNLQRACQTAEQRGGFSPSSLGFAPALASSQQEMARSLI